MVGPCIKNGALKVTRLAITIEAERVFGKVPRVKHSFVVMDHAVNDEIVTCVLRCPTRGYWIEQEGANEQEARKRLLDLLRSLARR